MNRITLAVAVIGALAAAGLAQAQTDTMTVRVGDLNLASSRGAAVALQRINMAARAFCGDASPLDFTGTAASAKCRRDLMGKAVDKMDAPLVTALYEKTAPPVSLAAK
jgi:UrcA family protein